MNKIVIFGGNGLLGTHLKALNPNVLCPTKEDVDIRNEREVRYYIKNIKPDIVVNAAAVLDSNILDNSPEEGISTNIIGAAHVANICIEDNIRYIYISTDYVYKGDRGMYKEEDEILPFNFYAWTKLGGECSAKGVKNHLIIRCSFGKSEFPYKEAFIDKWSSKDYIDKMSVMIFEAIISPLTGVLNLGTERKTLFDYAKERNKDVKPVRLVDSNFSTPYDTSLNTQKWINYNSGKPVCKPHNNCRICSSDNMVKYLDLGLIPLPNNLGNNSIEAKEIERFPLQVLLCKNCYLSQLSNTVDPERMYSYYTYRSGVNGPYIAHSRQMAKDLSSKYGINELHFHLDLAGNDGTLLKEFKEEIGLQVLNIDPAENIVAISEKQGIPAIAEFWNIQLAESLIKEYRKANLITATNVLAHVDDLYDFLYACKVALYEEGIIVIECPYIEDFIETKDFGQVYAEHLSYMSLTPLMQVCNNLDLKVIDVQKQNIHGGTMRYILSHSNSNHQVESSVPSLLSSEKSKGYNNLQVYKYWAEEVYDLIEDFKENIYKLKKRGYKIAGIAASAKGSILLNSAGINSNIVEYICDDTPEKIGKYSPGSGIPIVQRQQLIKSPVDYLLILSWNFKDKLIEVAREAGFKGKFILPLPKWQIID